MNDRSAPVAESPGASDPAELSVVVPSVNGLPYLRKCLEALEEQDGDIDLQIVVADRCGEEVRDAVAEKFPSVSLLPAPRGTTVPELRAMAVEASSAPSVAIIEDHVLVPPDWARRMLEARREGARVVGGGVRNAAVDSLVDRAAFLCEYGHLLGDLPEGPADSITGNNTVYDRVLLQRNMSLLRNGWEDRLHAAIQEQGGTLISRPDIVVAHEMHYSVWEYFSQRFHYSRSYSGLRSKGFSPFKRIFYAGAACLLPPILSFRIVKSVWKHPANRSDLVNSLHFVLFWSIAWAAGDAVGFLLGSGSSLQEVR